MTLEQLCGMSATQLAAITDTQLLEWFEKEGFLNVTRPERITQARQKEQQPAMYFSPQKQAAFEKLRADGVDIDSILKRARKK